MLTARLVHANMPLGTTFEQPAITAGDAFSVMASRTHNRVCMG